MKRRSFLQLAAAGAFALSTDWTRTVLAQDKQSLNFLVLGDQGSGNRVQRASAAAMLKHAQAVKAAGKPLSFVLLVGDNFYDHGVTGVDDPQWDTKFEQMYDKEALNFPFYAVLGNHDWHQNAPAQIAYASTRPGTRWRMDGFYYRRSMGGHGEGPLADFFFIDTNLWIPGNKVEGLGRRQSVWLDAELRQSRARWKFVVCHHPPYPDGAHALEPQTVIVRDTLVPLCKKYGVDAVFSGHDHDLQRAEIPGESTLYLVSGGGGASLRGRLIEKYAQFYQGNTPGFLTVQLTANTLKGQFMNADRAVLDSWTKSKTLV